ncbi:hypothetical protein VNO80_19841 [Phaseolus coccineus]|uniref:Pentatricopeptide repeat-containing protein n=1 Tax=Phaseolus coccineus TaxID=3886 RepID=A0AAN9QXQ7_PHACN
MVLHVVTHIRVSSLVMWGRTNMAKEVYDEMLHTYDVTPDSCTYNVLIRGFCKNSKVEEGFRFCNEMASFNCDKDVVRRLLTVCVERGRFLRFRYFCSDHPESPNARLRSRNASKTAKNMADLINSKPWSNALVSPLPTPLSKTTVLRTLRLIKDPSKALHFFKWAQQSGFPHTAQSYFIMLQILGRHRNLNVARNLLFSIEKKSNGTVKLGDRFFNTLIRSYAEAGLFKESLKLFQTMKSIAVSPSVVTFNSVLSILLKRGRTNMAKEVYDEMLHTYGHSL